MIIYMYTKFDENQMKTVGGVVFLVKQEAQKP